MTKPHEETWEHNKRFPAFVTLDEHCVADFDNGDTSGRDAARAQLAAQAPATARLLLELRQMFEIRDRVAEIDVVLKAAGVLT